MPQLSHKQYDALERAIAERRRIVVERRGTEFIVVPEHLRQVGGREAIEARHPTTGERLTLYVDELDVLEIVP